MARPRGKPRPAPTPAEVKALTDEMDWQGQHNLLQLYLADERSLIGGSILGLLATFQARAEYLERLAGIAPEQVDPEGLLHTDESDKELRKRTGRKSTDAVKTARQRVKKNLRKAVLPPFTAPTR
jgi:hypothetical protein